MNRRYYWLIAAIAWCIAIFIATASPSSTGGNTQSILQKIFHLSPSEAEIWNVVFRKGVHLSAFGLLAILFYNGMQRKRFLSAWLLTTFYAATDEIHQLFVPNRTGAVLDVGLDSLGAIIALVGMKLFLMKKDKKRRKGNG